jgi:predicted HNH restriction endonuclease
MNIHQIATQDPAERHAISSTSWSVEEYRALADRYADAVQLLQIAINNQNFAGIRSASLTLDEIVAQTAFLNNGLRGAIERAQQVAQKGTTS